MLFVIKNDLKSLPYYISAFAFVYLIRSLIIPLTPLGGFFGNMSTYGISTIQQRGAFPSGHTALVVTAFYLCNGKDSKFTKTALWLLMLIEIVSLLLSRGHYSIDIIGGVLISYLVVNELIKVKPKFVL